MGCHVPARREDQKVRERRRRIARACCKNAEDGWINVVDRDGADIDEFGQIVLVGNLSIWSVSEYKICEAGTVHSYHATPQRQMENAPACT